MTAILPASAAWTQGPGPDQRQVKNAQVALCHGNGGVLSSQITNILGTEAAL